MSIFAIGKAMSGGRASGKRASLWRALAKFEAIGHTPNSGELAMAGAIEFFRERGIDEMPTDSEGKQPLGVGLSDASNLLSTMDTLDKPDFYDRVRDEEARNLKYILDSDDPVSTMIEERKGYDMAPSDRGYYQSYSVRTLTREEAESMVEFLRSRTG